MSFVSAVLFATSTPAFAAADGSDPNTTGCASNSATEAYNYVPAGLIELRYSFNCATAWARFTCQRSSGCANYSISIIRSDGLYYSAVVWLSTTPNGGTLYTKQVNDGASYTAKACVSFSDKALGDTCTYPF